MKFFAGFISLFVFLYAQSGTASYPLTAIDPQNFRDYPGGRGEHQLIVYTPSYGKPTTGTNIWGIEATVRDNIVIKIGGNNSPIHNGEYVLSGHGRARLFLQKNVRVGSKVTLTDSLVTISFDAESFRIYAQIRHNDLKQKFERLRSHFSAEERETLRALVDSLKILRDDTSAVTFDSSAYEYGMKLLNEVEYRITASPAVEGRGVWHRPKEKSKEEIAAVVQRFAHAGFNMIFLETIWRGETIYPGFITLQKKEFAGFDPLRAYIDEGKKHGVEIHAWIHTFFAGYVGASNDTTRGPILSAHPDWQLVKRNGETVSKAEPGYLFLNPALPQVQEYIASLYKEVRTLYPDISGVQMDYVRFPINMPLDESSDYSAYTRTVVKKTLGFDPLEINPTDHPQQWEQWRKWRENVITEFVKKIRWENPEVLLSADIFPDIDDATQTKMQNWAEWASKGYVNALVPMLYSEHADWVAEALMKVRSIVGDTFPLYAGLAPSVTLSPLQLLEQIEQCRELNVQGIALFASTSLSDEQLRLLSIGPFRTKARPPQLIFKLSKHKE